jgi:hypothetical protein
MKERIEKFKSERMAGKKREFVETVVVEEKGAEDHDVMDLDDGGAQG